MEKKAYEFEFSSIAIPCAWKFQCPICKDWNFLGEFTSEATCKCGKKIKVFNATSKPLL